MNKTIMVGRLARENKISGEGDKLTVRNSIAVTRNYKNAEGKYDCDFIPIVAWGKTAELIQKYFTKGSAVGFIGHMMSGSYEKDGVKNYTLDMVIENIEFLPLNSQQTEGTPVSTTSVPTPDSTPDSTPAPTPAVDNGLFAGDPGMVGGLFS